MIGEDEPPKMMKTDSQITMMTKVLAKRTQMDTIPDAAKELDNWSRLGGGVGSLKNMAADAAGRRSDVSAGRRSDMTAQSPRSSLKTDARSSALQQALAAEQGGGAIVPTADRLLSERI